MRDSPSELAAAVDAGAVIADDDGSGCSLRLAVPCIAATAGTS